MNKREFVFGGCGTLLAGAAVAGALPGQALQAAGVRRLRRLPDLASGHSVEGWREYLDHAFRVGATSREMIMEAVEENLSSASLQQFTLVFRDEAGAQPLAAGTHVLAHRSRQRLALYLEPARRGQGEVSYRAHFSLLA